MVFQKSWTLALVMTTAGMISAMPAAAAVAYSVTVDTSSATGTSGFLDFQFNPGGATSQPATAQVLSFSGGTLGAAPAGNLPGACIATATTTCGSVAGSLPSVTLGNSNSLNEYFQAFTFASSFNFTLVLSGPAVDSPNGIATAGSTFCVGLYDAGQNSILTNQPSGCAFTVDINLDGTTTVTAYPPNANGGNSAVTFALTQLPASPASVQVRYTSNLNIGESFIDITNTGANGAAVQGPGFGTQVGSICVNVYAFDPNEELISCCSCLVTPDQTVNLGVNANLVSKTLTGVVPTSVTVKLIATTPTGTSATSGGNCTNSAAGSAGALTVINGMAAWGTTLHATPTAGSYATAETAFTPATSSASELQSIAGRCAAIIGNASGFGICSTCRTGALGGTKF
jgi:hypothetical protein